MGGRYTKKLMKKVLKRNDVREVRKWAGVGTVQKWILLGLERETAVAGY